MKDDTTCTRVRPCRFTVTTSPSSNAPALPVVNGTAASNAIALTIDASSPLASVGSAVLLQTSSGNFLVV